MMMSDVDDRYKEYQIRRVCHNCDSLFDDGDVRESWLRCNKHLNWDIRRDGYCKDHEWNAGIQRTMAVVDSYED